MRPQESRSMPASPASEVWSTCFAHLLQVSVRRVPSEQPRYAGVLRAPVVPPTHLTGTFAISLGRATLRAFSASEVNEDVTNGCDGIAKRGLQPKARTDRAQRPAP